MQVNAKEEKRIKCCKSNDKGTKPLQNIANWMSNWISGTKGCEELEKLPQVQNGCGGWEAIYLANS